MLSDYQPMYVYLIHTSDGVPMVQVAWVEDGEEMYANHTLEGADWLGLGRTNCLPYLVLTNNANITDTTIDELENKPCC